MYKVGDEIKVLNHSCGHNYTLGETYIITNCFEENCRAEGIINGIHQKGNWIPYNSIELAELPCTCGTSVCNNCKLYRMLIYRIGEIDV